MANRLGIRDADELAAAEHEIVALRLNALAVRTLPGAFDIEHLRRFHENLFGDVYHWAGELRTVNIAKAGTLFCSHLFLEEQLAKLFEELAADAYLIGLTTKLFLEKFASLYGELNALHPFREGNGRTQRAFLQQLAAAARWDITWKAVATEANIEACRVYSRTFDPGVLMDLLQPAISPRAI